MLDLGGPAFGLNRRFPIPPQANLQADPVTVNGIVASAGDYIDITEDGERFIQFEASQVPGPGAVIDITYDSCP